MGGGSTRVPKLAEMDYAKEGGKFLSDLPALMQQSLGIEKEFRPEFAKQNLADISQYTRGLQRIQGQAAQSAQGQLSAAKARELASMTALTGAGRQFLQGVSPEQDAMLRQATQAAQQAYSMSGTLSPDQMRSSTQQARESAAASGRVGGNADISAQILNREQMLGARRGEAAQAGQMAFGMGQSMYQAPLMALLGAPSQAYGAGQQFSQYGMGMLGQSTPQLVDPTTGINLAAAYRKDKVAAQSAQAQANAAQGAGTMGAIGSALGSAASVKMAFMCIPEGQAIDIPGGSKKIEDLDVGDTVIGFDGTPVLVLQKHSYLENPDANRFLSIELVDGGRIEICDKHKIDGIESGDIADEIFGKGVKSITRFAGITKSFDLLTSDAGYRIHGVPVNSMIEEMASKIQELQTSK